MAGLAGLESQTGMKLFNAGGRFNFSDQDEDGLERIGLTFSAGGADSNSCDRLIREI